MLVCVWLTSGAPIEPRLLLLLPAVLVVGKLIGLYDRDDLLLSKSTLDELPRLFQLATLYTLLVWLAEVELVDSRPQVLGLWLALFVTAALARMLARRVAMRATEPERCLFVGSEPVYRGLATKLHGDGRIHAAVVGMLPVGRTQAPPSRQRIERMLDELAVDRVIIALHAEAEADATLELITDVKACGRKVSLMPRMLQVVGSTVEFDDVDGIPMLGVRRFGLSRSSMAVKRVFDVALSAIGLIAVAPLMALIALAIRIDSPGPAVFRQTRVGRDGAPFEMLKFRSMVEGADARKVELLHLNEAHGLFKIAEDPRITRVGRLLRRSCLDELPQLVNVLRGEMSLIGPRPLVSEDDCRIRGWHRRRLHLKPGMTGQWQILGSSRIPLDEMVTIDYLYVANWSLWVDVKILLRTFAHVAGRHGR